MINDRYCMSSIHAAGIGLLLLGASPSLREAEPVEWVVSSTADSGSGSLREAILESNCRPGPESITFDPSVFADPQVIELKSPLPEITGEVTIDGYIPDQLWKASGATISGRHLLTVFRIAPGGRVTIRSLTIADGAGIDGGGIVNRGELVLEGVTLLGNTAIRDGGGLFNSGGILTVINSTFARNTAGSTGGGLAAYRKPNQPDTEGQVTSTNCTFSENSAIEGGALYSEVELLLRNTILANSGPGIDCVSEGPFHPASTHNLIETHEGCGAPLMSSDPQLQGLGGFNGPTQTYALLGRSPAINMGDNASAVDADGQPLVWDQRGNGDPRFVGGFTDIGAFEHQRFPSLVVDTREDSGARSCTEVAGSDCTLRGAIRLANATPEADVITFAPRVFAEAPTLVLTRPLPEVTSPLTLDASGTGGVTIVGDGDLTPLAAAPGIELELVEVEWVGGAEATAKP